MPVFVMMMVVMMIVVVVTTMFMIMIAVVTMGMVVIMVMIVVCRRLVLQPAADIGDLGCRIVEPAVKEFGLAGLGQIAIDHRRARIERPEPRLQRNHRIRRRKRHLADHQPIGHRHLLDRFFVVVERRKTIGGIDNGDDAIQPVALGDDRIAHHRLQHRRRIGKAGCFDDHALQRLDLTRLHPVHQVGQRIHQLAAHRAAEAAIRQLDDPVARCLDQKVIQRDITEFIDDHGGIGEIRILQEPVQKGRFSSTEKTGEDRHRHGVQNKAHGLSDQ
jgi:hypothetical protein